MSIDKVNRLTGMLFEDIAREQNQRRMIRKELRKEMLRESNRENEEAKVELKEEVAIFEDNILVAEEAHQNAWDGEKIYNNFLNKSSGVEEFNKKFDLELIKNLSFRYIDMEGLECLIDVYMDQVKIGDMQNLVDEIEAGADGLELNSLNLFIKNGKLSIGQTYMLLCYLMEKLRAKNLKKEKFLDKLRQWIMRYEKQESSYLLEFFSLAKIKTAKGIIGSSNIDLLAKLNTAKTSLDSIKTAIDFIRDAFENDYEHIVSLYIKLRSHQLKLLAKKALATEDKAQLIELINTEKSLVLANSLYKNQVLWYEELGKKTLVEQDLFGKVNINELLHGVVEFLSSSFVSKLSVDKLFRICKFSITSNEVYSKLLVELSKNVNKLPQALYEYKLEKLKSVLDKLYNMINELPENSPASSVQEPEFLNKSVSSLKRYV